MNDAVNQGLTFQSLRHSPDPRVLSVVVPIYKNERSLIPLCEQLEALELPCGLARHVVFVVDGSPDHSFELLRSYLESWRVPATLIVLSRNYGSFSAIRA